jgi:hypothetical protein
MREPQKIALVSVVFLVSLVAIVAILQQYPSLSLPSTEVSRDIAGNAFTLPAEETGELPVLEEEAGADVLEGIVDVAYADDFKKPENSGFEYSLRSGKNQYKIISDAKLDPSMAGAKVKVDGRIQGNTIALSKKSARELPAAAMQHAKGRSGDLLTGNAVVGTTAENLGPQRTLVIVESIGGAPAPTTVEQAKKELFGTMGKSMTPMNMTTRDFYNLTSYGKVSFIGDVVGPYAFGSDVCDTWQMLQRGLAEASKSVDIASYDRVVIAASFTPCIGYGGLGTIGKLHDVELPDGRTADFSVSWDFSFGTFVVAHELGHNFGGNHANLYECMNHSNRVQYSVSCSSVEYGDLYDVLGGSYVLNQMNAAHRTELGWLEPAKTLTVTEGDYTLVPLDKPAPTGKIQQLIIPVQRDFNHYSSADDIYYSIDYRTNMSTAYPKQISGVGIRMFKKNPPEWSTVPYSFTQTGLLNVDAPAYIDTFDQRYDGLLNDPNKVYIDDINGYRIKIKDITPNSVKVNIRRIPQRTFDLSRPLARYTFENSVPVPFFMTDIYLLDATGNDVHARAVTVIATNTGANNVGYFSGKNWEATSIYTSPMPSYAFASGFVPTMVNAQNALTMAMWVQSDELPADGNYYYQVLSSMGNTVIAAYVTPVGRTLMFRSCGWLSDGEYRCNEMTAALPVAGRWYHVAAVYDGTMQYLYVDGVLQASTPVYGGNLDIASSYAPLWIGGQPFAGYGQFEGYMDDITFWAKPLSAEEIAAIAANPPEPLFPPDVQIDEPVLEPAPGEIIGPQPVENSLEES